MILARRNFKRMLSKISKEDTETVQVNSNQLVMQKAKIAAERIGLTLEMMFRAADTETQGKVLLEEFKIFMRKIKYKITPGQMTRFLFLIDEECTGTITRIDYYSTLAAYGVNTERGWALDSFRTFEQQ